MAPKATHETATGTLDDAAHILVIDDDKRLRGLLHRYLSEQGFRVTAAENAAEARRHLKGIAFDLLVLDVMMPGETGLDLAEAVKATSEVPILMLTAMGTGADRIEGLERGADDYLTKPFEPRELVLRIRNLLKRKQTDGPAQRLPEGDAILRFGDCQFDAGRGLLTRGTKLIKLTDAEKSLLLLLAARPGTPISRRVLARELGLPQERSVDVQMTRLRRKIERNPKTPRHLVTQRGVGYALMIED